MNPWTSPTVGHALSLIHTPRVLTTSYLCAPLLQHTPPSLFKTLLNVAPWTDCLHVKGRDAVAGI